MSDSFTKVTHTSFFDHIKGAFFGTIFWILLFVGSFYVLFTNEWRVDLSTIAAQSVELNAGGDFDWQFVSHSWKITTDEVIGDDMFLVAWDYIYVKRIVEMYSWVEKKDSDTQENYGWSKTTTTSYTYEKKWDESPSNSRNFERPEWHENPEKTIDSSSNKITEAKIGEYTMKISGLRLPWWKSLSLTKEMLIPVWESTNTVETHNKATEAIEWMLQKEELVEDPTEETNDSGQSAKKLSLQERIRKRNEAKAEAKALEAWWVAQWVEKVEWIVTKEEVENDEQKKLGAEKSDEEERIIEEGENEAEVELQSWDDLQQYTKEWNYLFIWNGTIQSPQVWDMRISYKVIHSDTFSTIFWKVQWKEIVRYTHDEESSIYHLFDTDRESSIETLHTEFLMMLWIMRGVWFLMMWIWLQLVLWVITTILSILPPLARFGRAISWWVTFVAALLLSGMTILVGMIFHNIFMLIGAIVIAIWIAVFYFMRKKRKTLENHKSSSVNFSPASKDDASEEVWIIGKSDEDKHSIHSHEDLPSNSDLIQSNENKYDVGKIDDLLWNKEKVVTESVSKKSEHLTKKIENIDSAKSSWIVPPVVKKTDQYSTSDFSDDDVLSTLLDTKNFDNVIKK